MNHDIKIEKDIPIPGASNEWISLINQMEVGDSFLIPNHLLQGKNLNGIRSNLHKQAKTLHKKITSRKLKEGLRVWRVE